MAPIKIDTDYLLERLLALLATPSPTSYTDTIVRRVISKGRPRR